MTTLELTVCSLFGVGLAGIIASGIIQLIRDTGSLPNKRIANILHVLPSFLCILIGMYLIKLLSAHGDESIQWNWFTIGTHNIKVIFDFNPFTVPLMIAVASISFLVHLYAVAYIPDTSMPRFYATLGLFTLSMLGLTLSGNLLQLFMFWEIVGICSYLLIGFYRDKPEAAAAATKALIFNKIGDACFLIALMMLWSLTGNLDLTSIASFELEAHWKTVIGTMLLVAALAKSAQFPFHTWLPDAMVGPTPVSALIHSATMVAAGVFLIVRLGFLFTPITLQFMVVSGGATAFIGGINAIKETDLKRLLAWSTLSQLGLMFMIAGGNAGGAAFLHLIAHAIYKAGLFLIAGIIIHHYHIKNLNGSVQTNWALRFLVIVLTLALMGSPFTIGFLSKELMVGSLNSSGISMAVNALSFITAFYSTRLLMFIKPDGKGTDSQPIPLPMLFSVGALATATLWIFYSLNPFYLTPGVDVYQAMWPSTTVTLISTGIIFLGLIAGIYMTRLDKWKLLQTAIPSIHFDYWLQQIAVKPIMFAAKMTQQADFAIDRSLHATVYLKVGLANLIAWADQNLVDGTVHQAAYWTRAIGNVFRKLVTGRIQDYIWWTLLALITVIWLAR